MKLFVKVLIICALSILKIQASETVGGFDNYGVLRFGEAKKINGILRTCNEASLEFFIMTDHWRVQSQAKNIGWHSKKPALNNLPAKQGKFSGIAGKAKYNCSWNFTNKTIDIKYNADISQSKKEYRAVNYAGMRLSFDLREKVLLYVNGKKIDFSKIHGSGIYGKCPKAVKLTFSGEVEYNLTPKGFQSYNLRKRGNKGIILFRVPKLDNISKGCGIALQCNEKINKIYPENFEFTHDQNGWFKLKPEFDMKFVDVSKINLDAPAGKYGFLKVKNGKFYFEKSNKPVKFIGVQLVHGSKFPGKKEAQVLAKRIAAMGANIVRLHHVDYFLKGFGLWDRGEFDKYTRKFDKKLIDKMDYLIWELKKRGVYVHLDGITFRKFKSGDGVPSGTKLSKGMKGSAYVLEQAEIQQKQLEFFTMLWNHYNPYTKLKYKDDPAIALTEIINENDLFTHASLKHHFPEPFASAMKKMFAKWQQQNGYKATKWEKADPKLMVKFRIDIMKKYYRKMYAHLREIGVKIPITGTNWLNHSIKLGAANDEMDYTADHPYSGSELFTENPNGSKGFAGYLAMGKVYRKPLVHNEWNISNSCGINRAASILYHIAMSSSMGHDGSILFALFHHEMDYNGSQISSLNVGYDPGVCAIFPATAIMFLRNDIQTAKKQYLVQPSWNDLYQDSSYKEVAKRWKKLPGAAFNSSVVFDYSRLGKKGNKIPFLKNYVQLADFSSDLLKKYPVSSSSKELVSYWKDGYFLLKTPKSKWAAGYLPANKKLDLGNGVSITMPAKQYACVLLTSLDNKEIDKSKKIMITAVSYIEQPGLKFNKNWRKAINLKKHKILVAKPVRVRIKVLNNAKFTSISAINTSGKIIARKSIKQIKDKAGIPLSEKALVYILQK